MPLIHFARTRVGLTADTYPDAVILALIHIESAGRVDAISPSGQHFGILQCMNAYVQDACERARQPVFPARQLLGSAELSVWVFLHYMERYAARHDYDPRRIAALHKGGAGTAKTLTALLKAGVPFKQALAEAAAKHRIPNLSEYVRRFDNALAVYQARDGGAAC